MHSGRLPTRTDVAPGTDLTSKRSFGRVDGQSERGSKGVADGFGEQLRRHRVRRRLTQETLAERAGISARSIGEMERGRRRSPRLDSLKRLAMALELQGVDHTRFVEAGQALFWSNRAPQQDRTTAPQDRMTEPPTSPGPARLLPVDPVDFVGRDDEFAVLDKLFDVGASELRLAVLSGPPGVGKTALAVHAGHHFADRFPDGQLFVVLDGAGGSPVQPAEALEQMLRMLGVDGAGIPAGVDARAAALRARLAGRSTLIVLDSAVGHHQVAPLLPADGAAVMVTSRLPLTGLPGVTAIDLTPLTSASAVDLLGRVAGERRVVAEPQAAAELVAACGNLPLAVRVAAARLAARPEWKIGMFAGRLADERRRLDELRHGDLAVRPALQVSHRVLTPTAARAFALLGELSTLGVRSFPDWTVALLLDAPAVVGAAALDELLDARLVEPSSPGDAHETHYRFHEVTRIYARECREAEISDDEWVVALGRVGQGWLVLARQARDHLHCERLALDRGSSLAMRVDPRAVEVAVSHPVDWFEGGREALAAVVTACAGAGLVDIARDLAGSCAEFYELRGYYDDWRRTIQAALGACRAADDRDGTAALLRGLGSCLVELDDWAAAEPAFRESCELAQQLADSVAVAMVRKELGFMLALTGRVVEAETELRAAIEGLGGPQHAATRAIALNSLGFVLRQRGETEEAVTTATEAFTLARDTGDPFIVAYTSRGLAGALLAAGRTREVEAAAKRAALLYEQLGDLVGAAQSLRTLGEAIAQDRDRTAEARQAFTDAAALFTNRSHTWGLALTELSLGELAVSHGIGDATEHLHKALRYWTENAVPPLRLRTLVALATAAERSGDPSARQLLVEAYGLSREISSPMTDELARRLDSTEAPS